MKYLVCFLEEPSSEEMLRGVLPRILSEDVHVQYVVFEGKQDLDKQLSRKLRGWQSPNSVFLILRDKDAADCLAVKRSLMACVEETRKQARACIRIACHELESFYLGDLAAVDVGLGLSGIACKQKQAKFRTPDSRPNPAIELQRLAPVYQKISGSRAIAPHLATDGSNRSLSFNVLLSGVRRLLALHGEGMNVVYDQGVPDE